MTTFFCHYPKSLIGINALNTSGPGLKIAGVTRRVGIQRLLPREGGRFNKALSNGVIGK